VWTEAALLLLVALLIAANGVFVAAEFSFVTVDRPTVDRAADSGDRRAGRLRDGLRALSTHMSGAQFGITITSLVVGFIAEPAVASLLTGPLAALGLSEQAALPVALILALMLTTGFQAVFGELVPKNWAISQPLRVGRAVAGLQIGFTTISGPLLSFLHGSANKVLRLLGIEPKEELISARSPQELASLVSRSRKFGVLDDATANLVTRSILFGDRTVADVMTPRPRVHFLNSADSVNDVIALVRRTGHARFPVVENGPDDVVGIVHFKQVLAVPPDERDTCRVGEIARPAPFVPETLDLDAVLEVLRESPIQLAVVIDEYGGNSGLVTLEDLVEEIVGEILDEQDQPDPDYARDQDGAWLLSGLLRPDEVSEVVGVNLPEGEQTETLGGLIIESLGRLPREGDSIVVTCTTRDDDDETSQVELALTVSELDGRRIDVVRARMVHSAGDI
jgi:CBS domain containing-hemolysin-like protein